MLFSSILFICVVFFIVLGIDVILQFYTWQSRIEIGRYATTEHWKNKLAEKAKNWLQNMPTVPAKDTHHGVLMQMIRGNYKKKSIQSWQEGALLLGLHAHSSGTGDGQFREGISKFVDSKVSKEGKWLHPLVETDEAFLAYAILKTNLQDAERLFPAMQQMWNFLKDHIGVDGTLQYRKQTSDYRYVDTIGLVCPFLSLYGKIYNDSEAVDLAIRQVLTYHDHAYDGYSHLHFHAYSVSKKYVTGLSGWARGNAWWCIGLWETFHWLDDQHREKKKLKDLVLRTTESLLSYQKEDGSFGWNLTDAGSRPDSSATAVFGWCFSYASSLHPEKEKMLKAKEKTVQYLMHNTRRSGAVDFSQGDTLGIGNYSRRFDIMPFTQGYCLTLSIVK